MRIIAGKHRGATIFAPPGTRTRPTADKVRGAIFNMLGDIEGLTVLDLFAGSGALGLEALSRGASRSVFVENRAAALKTINRNVEKLVMEKHAESPTGKPAAQSVAATTEILRRDYLAYLKFAAKNGWCFDLIFIDPPYRMHRVIEPELGRWIPAVVSVGARVIVESNARHQITLPADLLKEKLYGDTGIRIYTFP